MDELKSLVGDGIYNKLLQGNVNSLFPILAGDGKYLECSQLSPEQVNQIRKIASDVILRIKFTTADQVQPWKRLSTGCEALDATLGGGIPINGITEIYGSSGVGKTQIGLQLALTVQQPLDKGGLGKGAVYICTEDVFPSRRLHELASYFRKRYNVDYEDNIYIKHIAEYEELRNMLHNELPKLLTIQSIGLIVIDSIAGPFRSENYIGNYRCRGKQIVETASLLHRLCDKYNMAVVCFNQVSQSIEEGKIIPSLGLAWSNNVTYRCCISRFGDISARTFEIIFAPDLPNNRSSFVIKCDGIHSCD